MNAMTTPGEVSKYLRDCGLLDAGEPVCIEALSGGVSNQVWKISAGPKRWVMKQALARLKVTEDWYSDVERIYREEEALSMLERLIPDGSVPKLVFADRESFLYIMTCAPEDAAPWKDRLLEGRFQAPVAHEAGAMLGAIHDRSRHRLTQEQKDTLRDLRFFRQLRIDPFYEHLLYRYPGLEQPIRELIHELTEQGQCLVHGDYSPKNMLADTEDRLILLDYEVAHWGSPAFDLAFCLAHLLLKGWALQRKRDALLLVRSFLDGYGEAAELPAFRRHLGVMLLARLDGKSPVSYIRDEAVKDDIRTVAMAWIKETEPTGSPADEFLTRLLTIWKGEVDE